MSRTPCTWLRTPRFDRFAACGTRTSWERWRLPIACVESIRYSDSCTSARPTFAVKNGIASSKRMTFLVPVLRTSSNTPAARPNANCCCVRPHPELPLVIARPSVVVGHTELGCGPSSSIYWFYRTVDALRRITFPLESYDDVDSRRLRCRRAAIPALSIGTSRHLYHISSGEVASVTWHEIAEVFARAYGERLDNPYLEVNFARIVSERPPDGGLPWLRQRRADAYGD